MEIHLKFEGHNGNTLEHGGILDGDIYREMTSEEGKLRKPPKSVHKNRENDRCSNSGKIQNLTQHARQILLPLNINFPHPSNQFIN